MMSTNTADTGDIRTRATLQTPPFQILLRDVPAKPKPGEAGSVWIRKNNTVGRCGTACGGA
jgi:hypothetical protein